MRFANAVLLGVNAGFGVNADFGERVRVCVNVRRLNMVVNPLLCFVAPPSNIR